MFFLRPQPQNFYLDIGCGTGNYTIALSKHGLDFTGVEPSENMLEEARKHDGKIRWLQGSAENIPVNDNTFDGTIATLTIHHWADIERSLKEIYRVTKDDGKIIFFTATPEQMKGYWLNYYFPEMLKSSMIQMPTLEAIISALISIGFEITAAEKYFVHKGLQDHFLYAGKHQPEIYFNEAIRNGISSFALANTKEVKRGLSNLYSDLKSEKFMQIKNSYEDNAGDYLFIVARKI